MSVKQGDVIAVWFSCGAASAVALQQTIKQYGNIAKIRAMNNPVIEEKDDNRRFLLEVETWLNIKIELVINPSWPNASAVEIWDKERYMSGVHGAPCTRGLKRHARQFWESNNHHDHIVMGFTSDEKRRADLFKLTERSNFLPVLIDAGISKAECYQIVSDAGIVLPLSYRMGYPNANCPGCAKSASPTYWNHVRAVDPEVFHARAIQSRRLGVKLVVLQGKRIFLDELPIDAKGREMKHLLSPECGIFCEVKQ